MDRQKVITTILIVFEALLLGIVLILCVFFGNADSAKKPGNDKQSEQQLGVGETEESEADTEEDTANAGTPNDGGNWFSSEERQTFSEAVEEKLSTMTTEQKVAQLFLTSPEALTGVDRVTISGNGTRDALKEYSVGGLIYAQTNFLGTEQATSLIEGAQGHSNTAIGLPLFILIKEDAEAYQSFATLSLTTQTKGALAKELSDVPALAEGIQTSTYTKSAEIVAAIKGGMDMIYAPDNFKEIYQAVLEAVNEGTISQTRLENAVGRVLTEKME